MSAGKGSEKPELSTNLGSLYDRIHYLVDPRHAHGKRYSLVTLLVIIFLAKLVGKDTAARNCGLG